jgi:outer membrane receptor protein involved in Fe transport
MMAENIPTLRGLATTYGWSYTPGSWLESIQLSKGASSVVNGYEAISGQINLEFKKPNNTNPLFVNLYADEFGCYEANITSAKKITQKLWTGLMLSGTLDNKPHDYNGDNFLDMPQRKFVNVYNRWFYLNPNGVQSRTGIRYLYENRVGGHDPFHSKIIGSGAHYTTDIQNKNITVENKTGFPVGSKNGQSIGIINSITHHEQNSKFGLKTYDGTQSTFYSNVLFTSYIGTNSNKYTLGGSFVLDNYQTQYQDSLSFNLTPLTALNRQELTPGLFGEYTFSVREKLTLIIGVRADYNSKYGWLFTPRANVKYSITDDIIARGSIGKGYRAPNVIADNVGIMASSRKLYVDGISGLGIESAWNYGGNLTFYIPVWDKHKLTFSLDYFHTEFQKQAIVDIERNSNSVFFYNLKGRSYADVLQADLSVTPFNRFDVFAAFRYNTTKITYSNGDQRFLVDKPLSSRFRGLVNLSYATKFKKWVFDFTTQINGPSRIPCLNGYNSELKESPYFPIYFAQVTKNTKRLDMYLGVENIFDFKQNNPIIGASNPFDQGFESSFVWGPIVGRKIYAGIRLRIGKLI